MEWLVAPTDGERLALSSEMAGDVKRCRLMPDMAKACRGSRLETNLGDVPRSGQG